MALNELNGETIAELNFSDLVDLLYLKVEQNNQAQRITVQYQTRLEETCIWSMDLLDDQDMFDIALFLKGFDAAGEHCAVHRVAFEHYANIPFDGDAKNWKTAGGDRWRADSQARGVES